MRVFSVFVCFVCCASLQAQIAFTNLSSGRTAPGVTAGHYVTAYGNFAGVSATQASAVPFPATLGGVTVSVDGTSAPLQFVGPTQINFLVPARTTTGLKEVRVTTPTATVSGSVRVVTAAPGIIVQDQATPPKGAIRNQDNALNAESSPARRGEVIQIFGTGPGALNTSIADGAAAPASPLARTVSTPQVFIAGTEAVVQFSGMTPGLVGLWQVNAEVPNRPGISGRVPVVVFIDGVDANEVAAFVAQ
ncbi:MAG: hypothetical protein SGI92_02830 [Bryobacteraceae bacterium]|nr:hypothetical protein [Bryobacteraceae bacterium]